MTPDEIWGEDLANGRQADLFNRRQEAEQLIAYIESVVGRPIFREDKRAYTIAVDARYGEGKSFFLRRLAEHLSINHPVAFVDAWADDLADEPLTALAATLKKALEPFAGDPEVQDRLRTFMAKSGKVAKIVGWGLLRRGAGLVLTGKAVDAAEDVISGVSDDVQGAVNDGLGDVASGSVDDTAKALGNVTSHSLMEKRVAAFEEGKAAVQEMKDSLAAIVGSLNGADHHPPIVIVIDELDRCRPTYAVKLLEEIKHLFDVPGLVFVMALHAEQLGHSVSGAYGSGFDGRAYLRRFIDRQYRLVEPDLEPLLRHLIIRAGLITSAFSYPASRTRNGHVSNLTLPQLLAHYLRAYGLGARDAFELVDSLQTSQALADGNRLYVAYLIPLIIGRIKGLEGDQLPRQLALHDWEFDLRNNRIGTEPVYYNLETLAKFYYEATQMDNKALSTAANGGDPSPVVEAVYRTRNSYDEQQPIWGVDSYPQLVTTVCRFTDPRLEE